MRYGVRILAHSRTFTVVAVLSLALGIGATTAIFTLVNSLLLHTLPVHEPERLVQLDGDSTTNPIWEQIQSRQLQLFLRRDRLVEQRFDLSQGGEAKPVDGLWVSGEFFEVLGVQAMLGRTSRPRTIAAAAAPTPSGGHQPRLLAAAIRRCGRRHWPDHQPEQGAVHHHRRHAARVHGT